MNIRQSECRYCGAAIEWAIDRATGNRLPLNPEPDPIYGNLLLDEWSMTFVRLNLPMIERAIRRGQRLYINHLSVCPVLRAARNDDEAKSTFGRAA